MVIKKPAIWAEEDVSNIRDKCYQITNDHSRYPPPLHLCAEVADVTNKHKFDLTQGFVKENFHGGLIRVEDGAKAPILQIVDYSSRYRN